MRYRIVYRDGFIGELCSWDRVLWWLGFYKERRRVGGGLPYSLQPVLVVEA